MDGDFRRRVSHARVRIGSRTEGTDRRGFASFALPTRGPADVSVAAHGYQSVAARVSFRRYRTRIVWIYQPSLQWEMFGATPERTSAQTHIRLRPPFRVSWTRSTKGLVEFPAVVSDGFAYIGNSRATIRSIDMRYGDVAWGRHIPHGELASSPAVFDDLLVVHGMDGHVWILSRTSGRILWHSTVGAPIESSPVVRDGIDYFGAWNGTVYALDLQTHRLRWTYRSGYKITAGAALAGGTVYIGDYSGRLLALSAVTGRLRFAPSVNGKIYATAAVAGGRVFVASSDGDSLTAFSTRGAYLWQISTGSYVYSSPAVWDGRVLFGSYNGVFYCVSARSGAVLWTHSLGGAISGGVAVVDGIAYAGSFAHRIIGVNVQTGRVVFVFPHGEYAPVSGNGSRLLLYGYSNIFAVEPRRGK